MSGQCSFHKKAKNNTQQNVTKHINSYINDSGYFCHLHQKLDEFVLVADGGLFE